MKSPGFHDPVRLDIEEVDARLSSDNSEVTISVRFRYEPWEPSRAQDKFMEQANALECVRQVLKRGGLLSDW